MTDASDPMAEIKASFFVECEELLEALQDGLQGMDDGTANSETINVVFRAVHSIKGGAGAFGLDALVQFAHRFETVMDDVRAGRLDMTPPLLALFFTCSDQLSDLVRASRDTTPLPLERSDELIAQLEGLSGNTADVAPETSKAIDFAPTALALNLDLEPHDDVPPSPLAKFIISFRPYAELFETGNEPYQILRALSDLGQAHVTCNAAQIPTLDLLASDTPYMAWTVTLETEATKNEISSIFEFVEGLCALDIREDIDGSVAQMSEAATNASHPTSFEAVVLPKDPDIEEPATPPLETTEAPPVAASASPATVAAAAKSIVRVDLDRIERLVNLVGELVINQAMLSQSLEKSGVPAHSDAMDGLEEFQRLTRDIQDSVMMIRAQPVKSLFQRMSRIVRESSGAVGKQVRLVTEGETTEIDKTVIERLADPLTHMIRNAVDHGLETPQDREMAGKPAQGQVCLTAAHKAGRVVIEVSDDGGGINREKVHEIALEKGLVSPDVPLGDNDIDNLLFLPGFSTATEVSNLSGRGVGMDVVRTEIQALGGRVAITSTPGQGTCFSISLPLTLAVLDGMVITVAEETLVVPLTVVTETMSLHKNDVQMMRPGHRVVRVRDGFVPLLDLGATLGYRADLDEFEDLVALLVTQEDGTSVGFVIDSILDQRQVVIKGLHDGLYRAPGVAAATILGDGKIALIVDPGGIVEMAASRTPSRHSEYMEGAYA